MTHRRFGKLALLEEDSYESEGTEAGVALLPWGGSKGPARAAYLALRERGDLAWYYTIFLNPLPPALLEELRAKDLVIVPSSTISAVRRASAPAGRAGRGDHAVHRSPVQGTLPHRADPRGLEARTGELVRA